MNKKLGRALRPGQGVYILAMALFASAALVLQQYVLAGVELAESPGLPLNVFTFEPHPLQVLRPEIAPPLLTTLTEPQIAIKRIHNILRTVQLDALAKSCLLRVRQLERQSEKARIAEVDGLTGLSTLEAFCHKVRDTVKDRPAGSYVIVRWDIDRFKIYKDIYGSNGGDELLRYIGQRYQERPEWYSCMLVRIILSIWCLLHCSIRKKPAKPFRNG